MSTNNKKKKNIFDAIKDTVLEDKTIVFTINSMLWIRV